MSPISDQELGKPFCRLCDLVYDEEVTNCTDCGARLSRFTPEDAKMPKERYGFGYGFAVVFMLHTLQFAVSAFIPLAWMWLPITQFLYVIPAWHMFRKRGYASAATGVLVASGLSVVVGGLFSACAAMVMDMKYI